jgi:hypothetical protein
MVSGYQKAAKMGRRRGGSRINKDSVGADPRVSKELTQPQRRQNIPFAPFGEETRKKVKKTAPKRINKKRLKLVM